MTPTLDPSVLDFLTRGEAALSTSVGLVALGVLVVALTARVLLQGVSPFPQRGALRLLDVVVVPLLVVFAAILFERFRVLG
jgi:hypothetical protein